MARKKAAAKPTAKLVTPTTTKTPERGEPGYDPLKDPWNVGFQLGDYTASWIANKIGKKAGDLDAYDFYADLTTGKRPGETAEPSGGSYINLAETGVNEKTVLPPMNIWKEGDYLFDLINDKTFLEQANDLPYPVKDEIKKTPTSDLTGTQPPPKLFAMYVVEGEGTPGNYVWRVYNLPKAIAGDLHPKHPLMWKPEEKRGTKPSTTTSYWGRGSGGGLSDYGTGVGKTATKPSTPTMPAGVRIRCACGHWFKQQDLPGHATVCPAMEKTGEADWAIMCCDECGCATLDEAARCKPGFPRQSASAEQDAGDGPESPSGDNGAKPQEQLATA